MGHKDIYKAIDRFFESEYLSYTHEARYLLWIMLGIVAKKNDTYMTGVGMRFSVEKYDEVPDVAAYAVSVAADELVCHGDVKWRTGRAALFCMKKAGLTEDCSGVDVELYLNPCFFEWVFRHIGTKSSGIARTLNRIAKRVHDSIDTEKIFPIGELTLDCEPYAIFDIDSERYTEWA